MKIEWQYVSDCSMLFLSLSFFQASPELTETSQDRWFPKEGNSCVLVPGQGQSPDFVPWPYPGTGPGPPGSLQPPNEFLTARNIPPDHKRRRRSQSGDILQWNSTKKGLRLLWCSINIPEMLHSLNWNACWLTIIITEYTILSLLIFPCKKV